ncbi:3-phenylpropionate MFS transporter [Bacillus cereus]|uniref:3-phenylpropionate MFS transporter n=1 Tax=Bacillus cereus TaxID=1396 RepID=UPI0018F74D10|nr:3-phenylpropionate MFS transporter [Bacillus cereus]MBJ7987098.1 3-phenylpropionate MFS transporter [Bacillus cereus]
MNSASWLSTRYFTFFFTWGVFLPYWTVWLTSGKNFTVEEAGIIVSTGLIVRSFTTLYTFPYLCRKTTLTQLAITIPLLSFVLLILFIQASSFESIIVVTMMFSLFYPMLLPLNETMASILSKEENVKYGSSRLWGSVGYIAALVIVAGFSDFMGEKSIVYIMLLGCSMMFFSGMIQVPNSLSKKVTKKKISFINLFKSSKFVICISICILIQGAHAAYYNYGVIYLKDLGMNTSLIGITLILAVVAEIIFFSIADRFFGNLNISFLFACASLASIVRWLAIYFFTNEVVFVSSQLLHAFTFGLAHYTFIRYVNEEVEKELVPSAQGIYASLGMSLSTGILTFIGGYLYSYSPTLPFLGMALVSLPCLFLSFLLYIRYEKKSILEGGKMNHEA